MKWPEYVIALCLCLVGVFVFVVSDTIPLMVAVEKSSVVNSQFFPKLMGILLVLLSLVMGAEDYLKRRMPTLPKLEQAGKTARRRLLGVTAISLSYLLLFPRVGFLLSSVLFMVSFLWVLGIRKWSVLVIVSFLGPASVYLVFKIVLGVPLPEAYLYF